MIASLLRLFALRPFLTMGIMGIPVLFLLAIGFLTIVMFKVIVFIVLPIMLVVWVLRKLTRSSSSYTTTSSS